MKQTKNLLCLTTQEDRPSEPPDEGRSRRLEVRELPQGHLCVAHGAAGNWGGFSDGFLASI